jgi:DNA-binding transcriptional ArsR family regulator
VLRLDEEQERLLKVLANEVRLKILAVLWKAAGEELRVYRICRYAGLNRKTVRRHLPQLVDCGLVSKKTYGTVSLYTLNNGSSDVEALTQFFAKVLGR